MGNACSSHERDSESSSCCLGRRGGSRTHAEDDEIKRQQEPIMGNGSSASASKSESIAREQTSAPANPLVRPLPPIDVREESSMASVDSEVLSPPAGHSQQKTSHGQHVTSPNSAQIGSEFLKQLPDAVRQILHGCVAPGATIDRGAHITIYVTAADPSGSSVVALLDALRNRTEPEMRARAERRGACLRLLTDPWTWPAAPGALNVADDALGRISLANLNRLMETSHVIPVLVLGDTLGRTCLPLSIEAQDFRSALEASGSEADRLLVEEWYRADALAQPPCYRLQSAPKMTDEVQQRLLEFFVGVFSQELSDAYLNTLFEQEVHYSVCMSQELARRCIWIQDSTSSSSVSSPAASPAPTGASAVEREHRRRIACLQRALKSLIQERHIVKCQWEPDVESQVASLLTSIVDELLDEIEAKEAPLARSPFPRAFLDDVNQHLAFCQKAASACVNREAALMVVKRYLTGPERHPLIVHGTEGSGKTSLLARSSQQCHIWQPADDASNEMGVLLRFVRLTPQSHASGPLLRSLIRQASLLVAGRLPSTLHTMEDYQMALRTLFDEKRPLQRRVTFVVDGLDQLSDFEPDAMSDWLPDALPVNVKVLVSMRSGEQVDRLRSRWPDSAFFQLEELTASEARNLFDACLLQQAHSSHGDHLTGMAGQINQSHRPLTVKILSWQAGLAEEFRSDPAAMPCSTNIIPNLTSAFGELTGHDRAAWLVALITASRCGVSDADMDDLCRIHIGQSDGSRCWPALLHLLSPFFQRVLVGGIGLWSWRDPTIRQQMTETFLADPAEARAIHRVMFEYFWGKWTETRDCLESARWTDLASSHPDSTRLRLVRRALDEIPHHLSKLADSSDRWRSIWTDPVWLLAKLATSGAASVVEDVELTPADDRPASLSNWLALSSTGLDYDHRQVVGQLIGRGFNEFDVVVRVPSLVPGGVCLRPSRDAAESPCQVNTSAIYRLSGSDRAAVLSAVNDEMSLWDFTSGKCDKVLGNLQHQPLKVAPLSNDRCVVLCGRELRIYDINSGAELLKLKGMMNQKLPLFGLHGDSHVVSLSRNRMYVNLISLENGDCVTTFKVGEDRFLNSLLVSNNGRILVCGDESKRPCSLLVWDLQTKKLIYDLKMNHHEFITRLSAITGDGTYVACVCKELETTDPNFIVVYDLESGTLFKKWKAGANTVAVSIGCQNSCVVTSLQDARILVWDLGTGNCRWTLTGHSAAVDTLNLDADGRFLLSWDSQDNDRSLRLWDLENGQDVATFTPDQRTTAAQISADGRVVLLALAGRSDLIHLKLCPPGAQQ